MGLFDFFKKKKKEQSNTVNEIQIFKNKEELKEKFLSLGLDNLWEKINHLVRNSIRMILSSAEDSVIGLGASKIGGNPDLPKNRVWPYRGEVPLSFIAQINFAEITSFDLDSELPSKGIVYFFYDLSNQVWGFDPKDKEGFLVFFEDGNIDELIRTKAPKTLADDLQMPVFSMSFFAEVNVPNYNSIHIEEIEPKMDQSEMDIYCDNFSREEKINKLLGHSDNIQGPMEGQCQLVTNGLYCGDASGYNDPRAKELQQNATDWVLLFQIDSNDPEFMWGDNGMLYLWILKKDLKEKNFSNTWLIQQCY